MPLTITRQAIASAMKCNAVTVSRRLKGVPFTRNSRRENIYQLGAVLPRVKRVEHIGPLVRAATDDSALYVGSGQEVMQTAEHLDQWLSPGMRARYAKVRAAMLAGLTSARGGAAFLPFIEDLNRKVLLHSDVLKHVVTGTPNQISFAAFAPAFCLINSAYEPGTVFIDSTRPELGEWKLAA